MDWLSKPLKSKVHICILYCTKESLKPGLVFDFRFFCFLNLNKFFFFFQFKQVHFKKQHIGHFLQVK